MENRARRRVVPEDNDPFGWQLLGVILGVLVVILLCKNSSLRHQVETPPQAEVQTVIVHDTLTVHDTVKCWYVKPAETSNESTEDDVIY